MFDKLRALLAVGKTEEDSPRDGAFSTYTEWHALTIGLYFSLKTLYPVAPDLPDYEDVQKEPHYFHAGYILGTIFQTLLLLFLWFLYLSLG